MVISLWIRLQLNESPVYQQNPSWFWPNDNGSGGNCVCGGGCNWDKTEAPSSASY